MIHIRQKVQKIFDRFIHAGEEPELSPRERRDCTEIMDEFMRKSGGRRVIEAPENYYRCKGFDKKSFMENKKKKLNRIEVVAKAFRIFSKEK